MAFDGHSLTKELEEGIRRGYDFEQQWDSWQMYTRHKSKHQIPHTNRLYRVQMANRSSSSYVYASSTYPTLLGPSQAVRLRGAILPQTTLLAQGTNTIVP